MEQSTVSTMSDMNMILRAQVMQKALGKDIAFDRSRILELLRMFIVIAAFEQILDPALRKLPSLPRKIVVKLLSMARCLFKTATRRKVSRTSVRTGTVSYITEDHKINDLFESVEWFINEKLKDEAPVKKDLVLFSRESKTSIITMGLPEDRTTEITYEQCTIRVHLKSEKLELYSDRTYTRKNRIISLSVEMEEDDNRDILGMFVNMCDEKYARHKKSENRKPEVYRSLSPATWEKTKTEIQRRPETVVLRGNLREKIFEDLDQFMMSEDWYRSRDVPYTRR